MEADLLNKFKMGLSPSPSVLCRICGLSVNDKRPHSDLVYQKFCKEINYFKESKSEACPLCSNCLKAVRLVMKEKERADEVEGEVRKLQKRLLILLGKLQHKLTNYYEGFQRLEEIIEENTLPKPGKMSAAEQLERKEVALVRYKIIAVACDLKIFQGELAAKGVVKEEGKSEDQIAFDDIYSTEDVDVKVEPVSEPELDNSFAAEVEDDEEFIIPYPGLHGRRKRRRSPSYSDNADVDMADNDDYIPSPEEDNEASDEDKNNQESRDQSMNIDQFLPPSLPDPSLDLLDTYPELKQLSDSKRIIFSRIIYHFQQEAIKKGRTIKISSKPIDPSEFSTFTDLPPTPTEPQNAPFRYDRRGQRIFIGEVEILVDEAGNSVNCSKCDHNFNYLGHRILPYLVQDHIIEVHFPPTTGQQTEINMRKRMRGEAYTTKASSYATVCEKTGERLPRARAAREARVMGPPCTSNSCRKRRNYCHHFSEEDRFEIYFKFWKTMNWKEKEEFVASHTQVVPVKVTKHRIPTGNRTETYLYFLDLNGVKVRVCQAFVLSTVGIGKRQLILWTNPTKYKEEPKPRPPRPKKAPTLYPCPTCGKTFPMKSILKQHEKRHVMTTCHGCGREIAAASLKKHLKLSCKVLTTDPPYLVCPQCGRMQKGQGGLNDHLRIYHAKKATNSTTKSDFADNVNHEIDSNQNI